MPKYKCINETCSLFDITIDRNTELRFDKKFNKTVDTGLICPDCNKECISIKEHDGYCTTVHSNNVPNN